MAKWYQRKAAPRVSVKAPKRKRAPIKPFSIVDAHVMAAAILAAPVAKQHIERPAPSDGVFVASWVLPLELCPRLNALAELPNFKRKALKTAALKIMLAQCGLRRAPAPLPGRPIVRAVRFSSGEPDRDAAWTKVPIDRLCMGSRKRPKSMLTLTPAQWKDAQARMGPVGLGYLADDKPSALDLQAWWEPCAPGHGCVYIELWTGAEVVAAPARKKRATVAKNAGPRASGKQ
jgi:hypothetical protein